LRPGALHALSADVPAPRADDARAASSTGDPTHRATCFAAACGARAAATRARRCSIPDGSRMAWDGSRSRPVSCREATQGGVVAMGTVEHRHRSLSIQSCLSRQ
jgi:hypothetical protein